MARSTISSCELCDGDGGATIFRSAKWRVVRVEGPEGDAFPGFCRVIWNEHVRELTDLSSTDRHLFMDVVFRLEAALRTSLSPHKMNVASLGNLTPHLHWHVIPRYADDPAFPKPIWAVALTSALTPGASLATLAKNRGSQGNTGTQANTGIRDREGWEEAVRRALESV